MMLSIKNKKMLVQLIYKMKVFIYINYIKYNLTFN